MWKEMDKRLISLADENKRLAEEIKKNRLRTSQEKLMRKYKVFIVMEAMCIPLMFLVLGLNPNVVEMYRWPTLIYFICFFLMEICIDGYLCYRLNNMNFHADSVADISRRARANWRIHKIAILIGIPIAIGAVALFCLAIGGNKAAMAGVCLGGSVGIGIGTVQFFKFMKNYKNMTTDTDD